MKFFLILFFCGSTVYSSEFYKKISDLLDLTACAHSSNLGPSKCGSKNPNQSSLKAISETQFYNDLSKLEIDRLKCSEEKVASLKKIENLTEIKKKIIEIMPILKKIRKDINSEIGKNQILNGQIPKSRPPKSGTIEYQRKTEYDARNEEIKKLMALEEMLISQIPFSESEPVRDLIDTAVGNGVISDLDVQKKLNELNSALKNSRLKIEQTKEKTGQFNLSNDQKISMGTDEFLVSQMLSNSPENASQIKSLQCESEKNKNGQRLVQTVGTAATLIVPLGLASAGRLAFLMRAPMMANKLSQISRVAGYGSMLVGYQHGIDGILESCSKQSTAKISSSDRNSNIQCDYTSKTLVSDFNTSECILNATLLLFPATAPFIARGVASRTDLLKKYIDDIKSLPSLKKLSQQEKEQFLKVAGTLSDSERKTATALLANRSITPLEKNGLIQAHLVAENKGYFELTASELKQKTQILRGSGFTEPEADLILRSGLAGQMGKATTGTRSVLEITTVMSPSPNRSRLLGEIKSTSQDPMVLKESTEHFKDATRQFNSEMAQKRQISSKISDNDLMDLESVASRWGSQAQNPEDIAQAKRIYTETLSRRLLDSNLKHEPKKMKAYLDSLKSDPGSGNYKKASVWKIEAITEYLKRYGW
jgi:hypothetical protein